MNWLKRVDDLYSSIFKDVYIDDRRMKKRIMNNSSLEELVEAEIIVEADSLSTSNTVIPLANSESSSNKYSETRTTTVFTPGNDKMKQAMGVKMVADELLAATGTVIGGTLGLLAAARSGNPRNVLTGVTTGELAGRVLGGWMWSAING